MDSTVIELLTVNDDGHAVEGMKVPADRGAAIVYEHDEDRTRLAYLHQFFRYDDRGQPMPETLIRFFVPDWMCRDGFPDRMALGAVGERMGWDEPEDLAGPVSH